MNIQGFQKLTLLDFPGHTACTVFTGGCNLRCPFCHNSSLVLNPHEGESFSEEEILSFLSRRKGILDGVAVTGGEPLLQNDLGTFLEKIKNAGFLVKLDTNGFFPDRLAGLISAGLVDYVAMDIKNARGKYAVTCGMEELSLQPVEKSVSLLLGGKIPYEFRTTVVRELHTKEDIRSVGQWIEGAEQYFLQCFKDSGAILSPGFSACTEEEMHEMEKIVSPFVKYCKVRGI